MSGDQMDPEALAAAVPRVPATSRKMTARKSWSDPASTVDDKPDRPPKIATSVLAERRASTSVLDVLCGNRTIARIGRYRHGHRVDTLTERGRVRSVWLDDVAVPAACRCGTLHVLDPDALRRRLGTVPGRPEQINARRVERTP